MKEWLIPLATSAGIGATVCGALMTLHEFRLKLRAEARLAHSAEIEADVKLLKLFTDLMNIANGRGGASVASDKLFEALLPKLQEQGITDVMQAVVIDLPVGAAAQDAAMAAIGELGKRHPVLWIVAIRALESLTTVKPTIARSILDDLRAYKPHKN